MSSIAWIPRSDAAHYGEKPVICLYVCCCEPGPVSANRDPLKTNHWTLSCAISQADSIQLDATPSGPNMSLVLMASYRSDLYDHAAPAKVQLHTSSLTVNGLLNTLIAANYDKYQFTDSGQGCRYWIYRVIKLLETKGYLQEQAEVEVVTSALGKVWASDGTLVPAAEQTAWQEGKFWELEQ